MGVWSVPWKNETKAKKFAAKINEGITIKVDKTPSGELSVTSDAISFRFDEEALFGSDELADLIYDEAYNIGKSFDASKLVIDVLQPILDQMAIQPELPKNLTAVNIVRESIGLPPLSANRTLSESAKIAKNILTHLKNENIAVEYYDFKELKAPLQPMIKMLNRIPKDLEADIYYTLTVETIEKKEFELDFGVIPEIKSYGYDRPGLLKMCFVTP